MTSDGVRKNPGSRRQRAERGTGLILKAAQFAAWKHRDQRRDGVEALPYINHPIALAQVLWFEGQVRDPVVIAAALLHDTIEDTETTSDELRGAFGASVAGVVEEVTDTKWVGKQVRKKLQVAKARKASRRAKLVKLADKICNLRDIKSSPPEHWNLERQREYFDWARTVVAGLRGTNAQLERRFDQAYRLRP
jgi:guanosine-3',5'-bis(diphosphate) 3'-pyrophosphohydrolase